MQRSMIKAGMTLNGKGERHTVGRAVAGEILVYGACGTPFAPAELFAAPQGLPDVFAAPGCAGCNEVASRAHAVVSRHGKSPDGKRGSAVRESLDTVATRYVVLTPENGSTYHGAPLSAVAEGEGMSLCRASLVVLTDDAGRMVTYAPSDTRATGDNGELIKWCTLCTSAFKALAGAGKSPVMSDRRPENVDRFGHTPEHGEKLESVAARLGRVVPGLGITGTAPGQSPALPVTSLVSLGGSADGKPVVHAGAVTGTGSMALVCRTEPVAPGAWERPTGEGKDTPKLTCSACRSALYVKGARGQLKARVVALASGEYGNRPASDRIGLKGSGNLWDRSADPSGVGRVDRKSQDPKHSYAGGLEHHTQSAGIMAGAGGKEAKRALWTSVEITLAAGNRVKITLHRDTWDAMAGMYAHQGSKITGWDFFRATGKIPPALRYRMTTEQLRRLHNAPPTAAEKRAAVRAKAEKARERAEFSRNSARRKPVDARVVSADVFAGFLNRPGRTRDVAAK